MRPTLLFLFLILAYCSGAQVSFHTKLGASLKEFIHSEKPNPRFLFKKNGQAYVPVFIEFEQGQEQMSFAKTGVVIRTRTGPIATADIPFNNISTIASLPGIKKIELPLLFVKTDTLMKKLVTADRVLAGNAPLDRGYNGKNTLIGIIDDGIDITHPDFLDSTGHTRIKTLWNMDMNGVPPVGFHYGHLWPPDSLDLYKQRFESKTINNYKMQELFGYGWHGTSVTGLAAGKNGVAPGADIAVVALTAVADTLLRSDRVIDAISFIYSKAKELDKKCLINISLGLQEGAPHDGKTMIERAIDAFCKDKPDILINVSAGNNGNNWKHWAALPINRDSSFGFFRCAYESSIYFIFPRKDSDSITVSLTDSKLGNINSPNISRDLIIAQTPFLRISDLIKQQTPNINFTYFKNGSLSSTITFTAAHANEDYDELIIKVQEHSSSSTGIIFDDHLYRYIFKGNGSVHGWYPFWNLHPIYFFGNNPYPADSTYISTDNAYSTNIPSHAYTVLSSGAFNARECYLSTIHNEAVHTYTACQLTYFTSRGPTLDGRIKPDIISPGENVIAPKSRMDNFLGHQMIIDSSSISFSGTSASSPITAGVAALLWEYNPEFSRDDIIQRIKSTTYSDQFTELTGPLPNNISGWGKLDAFRALTGDTTDMKKVCAIREFCEARYVEPVPDPQDPGFFFIKFYPNPVNGMVFINYRSAVHLELILYTSSGQKVMQLRLPKDTRGIIKQVNLSKLSRGIYFARVIGKDVSVTNKLMISR